VDRPALLALAEKLNARLKFEETFMLSHWVGTTVQIRPEIRFDHAWDRRAYDNGTRTNQFTVASDVIFHF